ncbi:hypothetical protein [Profundibacterium mesophilum]|uniref:Uncharacterized protein n=1 Tax=Profundibacterium mesophilum KAUST100406-0324 TaxID=1037889 RepID=A0A921NR20_9RHOB|nr:hypothetical protein [Profundibacterium mesophilum]KAF0675980.1 hypothetical protein PMES_01735 [Profundibacterium mesophilum KAUST100406-0324]
MSFLRPEARAALWRWREALCGGAVTALGIYWMVGPGRLLFWVGGTATVIGAALIGAGIQRGRFRPAGGGPGVVRVVEGELAYFGPFDGGTLIIEDLTYVDRQGDLWILRAAGGGTLEIPVDAEGAEALFDVFNRLPGFSMARLLAEREAPQGAPAAIGGPNAHPGTEPVRPIWQRRAPRLH